MIYPYYTVEYGTFTIYGEAIPEDVQAFYTPIIEKLEDIAAGKRDLQFDFRMKYYNSPSIMYISRILTILQELSMYAKVVVNWYYDSDDEDMKEVGTEYTEVFKVPINMIIVSN